MILRWVCLCIPDVSKNDLWNNVKSLEILHWRTVPCQRSIIKFEFISDALRQEDWGECQVRQNHSDDNRVITHNESVKGWQHWCICVWCSKHDYRQFYQFMIPVWKSRHKFISTVSSLRISKIPSLKWSRDHCKKIKKKMEN